MANESDMWICRACWTKHSDLEPEELTIAHLHPAPCAWCGQPTTDTILNPLLKKEKIPVGDGQAIYMGPAEKEECAIHDWPTAGLARRLVKAMKATHPTGVNACRDCLARAKEDVRP